MTFSDDDFHEVFNEGIKGDLLFALQHQRVGATILLLYSGMDAMSYVAAPADETLQQRERFTRWVNRYICRGPFSELTADELWGARCAMLHDYSTESRYVEKGGRRILIADRGSRPILAASDSEQMVIVALNQLVEHFCEAVNECVVDLVANSELRPEVEERVALMVRRFAPSDLTGDADHG